MVDLSKNLITKYFPDISATQLQQLDKLVDCYKDWNTKINVISRKDVDSLVERHILHSLSIAKHITFKDGSHILDAGTGGGFPGLPLSILFPSVQFELVDSIAKKIKVVNAIAHELKLENVTARQERMENVKGQFDFIVSRAVAPMLTMKNWTSFLISRHNKHTVANGYWFLKGGDLSEEIKQSGLKCTEHELKALFSEPFFETKKLVHATVV